MPRGRAAADHFRHGLQDAGLVVPQHDGDEPCVGPETERRADPKSTDHPESQRQPIDFKPALDELIEHTPHRWMLYRRRDHVARWLAD